MFKKYVLYAKKHCESPRLDQKCVKKLEDFYVQLRAESKKNSGLNIVVRHLESLSRLALASAKLHLRSVALEKDCDIAIEILLSSFINSQKPSVAQHLKQKFSEYLRKTQSSIAKLAECLNTLVNR